MFISHPDNEFRNPLYPGAPGSRHWRAVEVTSRMPWFIATLQIEEEGNALEQTVLVSWDTDLVRLLETSPAVRLTELYYVAPVSHGHFGGWRACPVWAVWRSRDSSGIEADVFIFSTRDGEEFCGTGGVLGSHSTSTRQLIARLPEAARRQASGPNLADHHEDW